MPHQCPICGEFTDVQTGACPNGHSMVAQLEVLRLTQPRGMILNDEDSSSGA